MRFYALTNLMHDIPFAIVEVVVASTSIDDCVAINTWLAAAVTTVFDRCGDLRGHIGIRVGRQTLDSVDEC